MIGRRIPPIRPAASITDVFSTAKYLFGGFEEERLKHRLSSRFGGSVVALTDSGTSALSIAISKVVAAGGLVAIPAFGCIDVATAVQGAARFAVPYDVDPRSFAPVEQSLHNALRFGAEAVVVTHLFGVPTPMANTRDLCRRFGVPLIEDAAQAYGALSADGLCGSMGDWTIVSFGRGKGIGGGGGGAVISRETPVGEALSLSLPSTVGLSRWLSTMAAAVLSRPSLYGIPASIPALRLGAMVYHVPTSPRGILPWQAALATRGLVRLGVGVERRTEIATMLQRAALEGRKVYPYVASAGDSPSWLRAPFWLRAANEVPTELGLIRPYPVAVPDLPQIRDCLNVAPGTTFRGARELARTLATAPTYERLSPSDIGKICTWLAST